MTGGYRILPRVYPIISPSYRPPFAVVKPLCLCLLNNPVWPRIDRMPCTSGTKWSWWILFTAWCATTHASTGLSVVSNGRAEKPTGERVRTHKREVLTCKHVGAASKGEKFASFLLVASKQRGATGSLLLPAAPRDLTIRWHIFPWWTGMSHEVQLGRSSTFLNFQSWEASRINHFKPLLINHYLPILTTPDGFLINPWLLWWRLNNCGFTNWLFTSYFPYVPGSIHVLLHSYPDLYWFTSGHFWRMEHDGTWPTMWVKQCHKPSPSHPVITIFIGGMFTIPKLGW